MPQYFAQAVPMTIEKLEVLGRFYRRCVRRSLSPARTNDHRRNILYINEGVVKFGASQMGKVDDIVGNLPDPSSDLFSGSQVQLDSFARVALKDAEYSRVRLYGGFFLCEQAGASNRCNNYSQKK
jgi:hypothetical protein